VLGGWEQETGEFASSADEKPSFAPVAPAVDNLSMNISDVTARSSIKTRTVSSIVENYVHYLLKIGQFLRPNRRPAELEVPRLRRDIGLRGGAPDDGGAALLRARCPPPL
jgi:hypothetical protein